MSMNEKEIERKYTGWCRNYFGTILLAISAALADKVNRKTKERAAVTSFGSAGALVVAEKVG
jgi:hypothetical protein